MYKLSKNQLVEACINEHPGQPLNEEKIAELRKKFQAMELRKLREQLLGFRRDGSI